uniref:Myosin motor domain-containing protein n=1 Tax=Timema monikensis TaxID=170555 RepID=A0A7R9EAT2_9NEOP|nr:unnamed protein product [Timema monikensis]
MLDKTVMYSKHQQKEREFAAEHVRRFQEWTYGVDYLMFYNVGARVWIQHSLKVWEGAEVVEDYKEKILKVATEDGKLHELSVSSDEKLPPLRNPDILIGENDLTSLSYLHEPAVLYNLEVRFCRQNSIYTYCGKWF